MLRTKMITGSGAQEHNLITTATEELINRQDLKQAMQYWQYEELIVEEGLARKFIDHKNPYLFLEPCLEPQDEKMIYTSLEEMNPGVT